MKKQSFCVHGHFYQPSRINPLTGKIPAEPGAAPFHDWNERIYSQCYKPNADLGNFSRISFNIGPTLAVWLEKTHPETMHAIVEQEKMAYEKDGIGNGMAQAYNHTILPLAKYEDKVTQVRWGKMDFEYRFGHKACGMWLPETAVDIETLSVLADEGFEFTILAPWQAKSLHPVDTSHPWRVDLPEGKSISVFFYEPDLSAKVSFSPESTVNADAFLKDEILPLYPERSRRPRYQIIASDGELYGHHQPFRDKFLEWLTTGALKDQEIEVAAPGAYLHNFPATKRIGIRNNTSWSCHHGIKRWSGICDCSEHGEWKGPLRRAFNHIADIVDTEMQNCLNEYKLELLPFRNEYGRVLTGEETTEDQIKRLVGKNLSEDASNRLAAFMQAQYERQRMFSSCGWFFEDFDRIEARNNILNAAMAVNIVDNLTGKNYWKQIRRYMAKIRSDYTGIRASTLFDLIRDGK